METENPAAKAVGLFVLAEVMVLILPARFAPPIQALSPCAMDPGNFATVA
jgi:hypothetical protein